MLQLSRTSALVALVCAACGGGSGPDEMPDPDVVPRATSPAGDPYPTANIGPNMGQIAANVAFHGYPDSNRAGGLKTVQLADYYDPKGADHVLLFVAMSATWCSVCVAEAETMRGVWPDYRGRGVVMLEVIVAGASAGYGPSLTELDTWVDRQHTTWTVVSDVRGRRMAQDFGLLGVPSSMLIDTRTMEIIHQAAGAPDNLATYFDVGLDWIAKHPR